MVRLIILLLIVLNVAVSGLNLMYSNYFQAAFSALVALGIGVMYYRTTKMIARHSDG